MKKDIATDSLHRPTRQGSPQYIGEDFERGSFQITDTPQAALSCAMCAVELAKGFEAPYSKASVVIESLKSNENRGGYGLFGTVKIFECQACACAVRSILAIVPVEVKDVKCSCGSENFEFLIDSITLNKKGRDWKFNLNMKCTTCSTDVISERLFSFFKISSIKIGLTGVTVKWK